jgi:HSP20 family molecular chaperone IbpA
MNMDKSKFSLTGNFFNIEPKDKMELGLNFRRIEKDGDDVIEILVKGCSKEDVNVVVRDKFIYVTARDGRGELSRTLPISDRVDLEKITADVENGLLTITIPKYRYRRIL